MTTDRVHDRGSHRAAAALVDSVPAGSMLTSTGAKALAVVRIATGGVFLWAFADKTFGLRYSTASAKSWVNGGSPTKGFLSHVDVGPFQGAFHSIAGTWWADLGFMLGLLGIGVALVLGIGLRLTAVGGSILMAMMWAAEWPLARTATGGAPSGSSDPILDYHVEYALVMVLCALAYAGSTWGLGRRWAHLPVVTKNRWLI